MKMDLLLIFPTLFIIIFPLVTFASPGAEIIELPAAEGNITFHHKKHQEMLKDCTICHAKELGKIAEFGMKWGHKTCRGCHLKMKTGLTNCTDCHKKE